MMKWWLLASMAGLGGCLSAGPTANDQATVHDNVQTSPWIWNLPAGVALPAAPADNPMSEAKFQLGKRLFYDRRLSGNGTVSCASCHHQDKAFVDGARLSVGATGETTPRNSQPIANTAWYQSYTWANLSLRTLERQMDRPLFGTNPVEMGINDHNQPQVLARLQADSYYRQAFAEAFGSKAAIDMSNVVKAIASFQRGLLSYNSRYDQALLGKTKLDSAELRGLALFNSEQGQCYRCHGGLNFSDQTLPSPAGSALPFHNIGLYNLDGQGAYPVPNRGILELTGRASDMGRFRTPSLRNVELTAPYMHDGSVATLEQAVAIHANRGQHTPQTGDGRLNPYKDAAIDRIALTEDDQQAIVAFLKTLTDHSLTSSPRYADPFKP